MTKEELDNKLKKFIYDPDWVVIEDLLIQYIVDLYDLSTISPNLTNDQVASEVRGRMIVGQRLGQFLTETKLVKDSKVSSIIKPPNFK